MKKEIIKLKGTIDGVKIYLDANSEISVIITSLYEKLRQFRTFFGDGHCNIYFAGRELTASDKMRLEAVVSAMLPESNINYGERKRLGNDIEETLKLPNDLTSQKIAEEEKRDEDLEKIKEVVTTNFKSSRARFYEGLVKNGKTVESDGHLILVGDVEEGGKLEAVGNVIVMGSIKGSVEAGCMGNDGAYIAAIDFEPTDVRIAKQYRRFEKLEHNTENKCKRAYLINNQICVEDFLLKR